MVRELYLGQKTNQCDVGGVEEWRSGREEGKAIYLAISTVSVLS